MNDRKLCSCIHSVSMYAASSSQLTVVWELREYKNGQINVALAFEDGLYSGCQSRWKQNQGLFFTKTEGLCTHASLFHEAFPPYAPCPILFSIALIHTVTKSNTARKKLIFILQITVLHWGKSGQKLKAQSWSPKLKHGLWWNHAYWLAQCSPGPPRSKSGPAHSRLGLCMSITDKEGALLVCPQAISQLRSLFPEDPSLSKDQAALSPGRKGGGPIKQIA